MTADNPPTNYRNARDAAVKAKATRDSIANAVIKAALPKWTTFSRQHPLAADLIQRGADYYVSQCYNVERRSAEQVALNLSRWREATSRGAERTVLGQKMLSGFMNWRLPNGALARTATLDDWYEAQSTFTRNIAGNKRCLDIVTEAIKTLEQAKVQTFGELVETKGASGIRVFDKMLGELRT